MKAKMLIAPAIIMGMRHFGVDMEDARVVLGARVAFGTMVAFCATMLYLIQSGISKSGDRQRKVKVKQQEMSGREVEKTMSYREYDGTEWSKLLKSVMINVTITAFVHYQWKVLPALMISSVMTPLSLVESALFRIYVLGQDAEKNPDLKRPFKEDNPFAAMKKQMEGGGQEAQAELEPEVPVPAISKAKIEEIDEDDEKPVQKKMPAKRQNAAKEPIAPQLADNVESSSSKKQPIRLSGVQDSLNKKKS